MSWKPEDDEEKPAYSLAFPFTDQSESFVLGYECGRLGQVMGLEQRRWEGVIHSVNDEQIILMARHYGYRATFAELRDGWSNLVLERLPR